MLKISKIIPKILMISGVVALLALIYFTEKSTQIPEKNQKARDRRIFTEVVLSGTHKIQSRWVNGDIEDNYHKRRLKCENIPYIRNLDAQYFECNPTFLECFFDQKSENPKNIFKVNYNNKIYNLKVVKNHAGKFTKIISKSILHERNTPDYAIKLDLEVVELPKIKTSLYLSNTCSDTYLEQRIYAAGAHKSVEDKWDNFGQHVYIDKNLVTNRDVYEWLSSTKKKHVSRLKNTQYWHKPSTNLTLEQKKMYCEFQSKELLVSRFLDAASFLPTDLDNPKTEFIYKSAYPWNRNQKNVFLFKNRMKDSDAGITKEDCAKAYTLECFNIIDYQYHSSTSTSWSGIHQILGGYLEAVENKFNSFQNIKVSSFYFDSKSSWHEVGKRINWNGQFRDKKDFFWNENINIIPNKEQIPKSNGEIEVGFRCMKRREI